MCVYWFWSITIFFFCLNHERLAVLILLKVPSELAQPLRIPSWLRHLILCMNSINLPPRIWERWVSSSSLICDSSPAWKTIEIKPSRKVAGTELSPRPLQRKVRSCLQVYGVGVGVCVRKSIKLNLGTIRPGVLLSVMGFRVLASCDALNGRPRFPAGTEKWGT